MKLCFNPAFIMLASSYAASAATLRHRVLAPKCKLIRCFDAPTCPAECPTLGVDCEYYTPIVKGCPGCEEGRCIIPKPNNSV